MTVDIGERMRQQETAELLTAGPAANLTVVSANAVGVSNYFARSDHSHAITSSANPGWALGWSVGETIKSPWPMAVPLGS